MTDDTPQERLQAEIERKAYAAKMARNPRTPVHTRPTLQEEYEAQVKAGLHPDDELSPDEPARLPSTVDADIAAHVAAVVSQILSAP